MENSLKQQQLEAAAKIESKELYKGKFFSLRRDIIQIDPHPPHTWDIILHPGAVAVLPIKKNGNLLLIQQWRRPVQKILYEIVAGILEKNESPLSCAQRELQEEAGYKAEKLTSLGGFYTAPGFCTEYIHLFIAQDLLESSLPKDLHEAIDLAEMTLEDALTLIDNHEIIDVKTICAILRYERLLQKGDL